jgi:hypothetical protein
MKRKDYNADNPPPVYLSTSDGGWRLIRNGIPMCKDQDEEATRWCARQFGFNPELLPIWDGNAGTFSNLAIEEV